MRKISILVIEDDRNLADILSYNLRQEGYDISLAYDGQDGLTKATLLTPDLVVLDLMLPVLDGLEVCRRLRANSVTRHTLILMLTAKAEETDQVVGLSVGADDYVTKPFSVKVLVQRIKALHRRSYAQSDTEEAVIHQGICVDRSRHKVTVHGSNVALTPSEFRLLNTLIRQPGRVFGRAELIDAALGEDTLVSDRTIDVHIRGLRRKLGKTSDVIETVRGVGYRFRDAPES